MYLAVVAELNITGHHLEMIRTVVQGHRGSPGLLMCAGVSRSLMGSFDLVSQTDFADNVRTWQTFTFAVFRARRGQTRSAVPEHLGGC